MPSRTLRLQPVTLNDGSTSMALTAPVSTTRSSGDFAQAVNQALAETKQEQEALFTRLLGAPGEEPAKVDTVNIMKKAKAPRKKATAATPETTQKDEKKTGGEMTYGTFATMVNQDMDFRPPGITPHAVRVALDNFSKQFVDKVMGAKDFDTLMRNMERFIEEEQHHLFYRSNDFMTASIHKDYFMKFMNTLCIQLSKAKELDSDKLERIENLEDMLNLGLDAYDAVNRQMDYISQGDYKSLLLSAQATQAEAKKNGDESAKDLTLEDYAHTEMKRVLVSAYGIDTTLKAPPPLMILLAEESVKLARSQADALYPHIDTLDPACDPSIFEDQYQEVLNSWSERFAKAPTMQNAFTIFNELQKRIVASERLPEDFSDMIVSAAMAADKKAVNSADKAFKQNQLMTQTPVKRMRKMMNEVQEGHDSPMVVRKGIESYLGQLEDLGGCNNKSELLEQLDSSVDHLYEQTVVGLYHPAVALGVKEFLAEFRKQLGKSLHKAGSHDERFLMRLKEIEDKADLAHEANRMVGNWVMNHTNGGHDSLFTLGLYTTGSSGPEGTITTKDLGRIVEYGTETLNVLAQQHGIPESIALTQYMPLIYSRCADIAMGEVLAQSARKDPDSHAFVPEGSNAVQDRWRKRLAKEKMAEPKAQGSEQEVHRQQMQQIQSRALVILDQALKRMSGAPLHNPDDDAAAPEGVVEETTPKAKGKQQSEPDRDYLIDPTAHNLRIVMDFLHHIERDRAPRQMH